MRVLARLILMTLGAVALSAAAQPFRIRVVDAQTHRGVPLVFLTTTNQITFVTDSAGVIAFDEPGLLGQRVHFLVHSDGYRYPEDGFGYAGVALDTTPGGEATIEIERVNIAERLYRVTGQGIYRDSVLLGDTPPVDEPVINGLVMGQDSVLAAVYRGRIAWFWGDTSRPAYPLGNFGTSGATSLLPGEGGLDPSVGVNLRYFMDSDGFSRPMAPLPRPGPVWLSGLTVINDASGEEHLFAHFARVRTLGELHEQGIMEYNDSRHVFEPFASLEIDETLHPLGHMVRLSEDGTDYCLYGNPFPTVRVPAEIEALAHPERYEGFSCLAPGTRFAGASSEIERDSGGRAVWGWKTDTGPVGPSEQATLVGAEVIGADERWWDIRDVESGEPIQISAGSINWNEYRHRWVMIGEQIFGSPSFLGEVWYSEADSPTGPWRLARKIVTHERYSFYNPVHHAFFDQEGGRFIYFEGTYSTFLVEGLTPTPRYDYNQIMYRLDLADERLRLEE